MEVKWAANYTKEVELKEDGVKAVFLFTPNKTKKIDSAVWKILKKKMADDIISGRLVFEDKPVEDKPVEDKPVEDKPVEDKPVEDKPKRKRGKDKLISFGADGSIEKEEIDERE